MKKAIQLSVVSRIDAEEKFILEFIVPELSPTDLEQLMNSMGMEFMLYDSPRTSEEVEDSTQVPLNKATLEDIYAEITTRIREGENYV